MAVIYLQHPVHGQKVACSTLEADNDKSNGWVEFDPTPPVAVVEEEQVVIKTEEVIEPVKGTKTKKTEAAVPDFFKVLTKDNTP